MTTLALPTEEAHAAQSATAEDIKSLAEDISSLLIDERAEELIQINLDGKSTIADYMIIASGRSARHVSALADHLIRHLKKASKGRAHVEGLPNADWVLVDTGDIIVHLFRPEVRSFYNLERIWGDDATGHAKQT